MSKRFRVPEGLFQHPDQRPVCDVPGKATDARIQQTERRLGVGLPAAYTAVLKVRNGGSFRIKRFKLKGTPKRALCRDYVFILSIAGVHPTHMNALSQFAQSATDRGGIPKGLVPFEYGHCSYVCLDYRGIKPTQEPRITFVDLESERNCVIAPSFAALVQGLYLDNEELEPALIALDKPSISKPRLDAILVGLGCKRHKLPGQANPKYPHPPTWTWSKYTGRIKGLKAWIQFERNKLYSISLAKTCKRPDNHPLLTVAVCDADEDACLTELLSALGAHATLLKRSR